MFDELAILNGSRLMLLAGISYTLWSLTGVLFRAWSIGEVFFWMWWEIALSGISTAFLMHRWHKWVRKSEAIDGVKAVCGIIFITLLILAVATLFTVMALGAENVRIPQLPSYLDDRKTTLYVLAILALAVHLMAAHGPRFRRMSRQDVEKPLVNRCFAVLGAYLVMICAYHWSGSTSADGIPHSHLLMGCGLLGTKLLLELRQFFKASRPSGSGVLPVPFSTSPIRQITNPPPP